MVTITIDLEKCTGCGTCVGICPVGVYEIVDVEGSQKSEPVNKDQCIICMACEVSCPESAIKVTED